MFHLIFGLPWLVVLVRYIQPLPWHWSLKLGLALVLLVASQYHFVSRLSSGSVFAPEFPRPLVIAFVVVFGALLFLALFQIVVDLGLLLVVLVRWKLTAIPVGLRYSMGVLALAVSAYGVSQAIRQPAVKDLEVAIADMPPAFEGYRLIQLTDLHISRLFPRAFAERLVERTLALPADLIVVTGDLIDGTLAMRRDDVAPLGRLQAPDGVWVIPGNHEYFFGYETWMQHYATLSMRRLDNSHTVIRRGGAELVLAGVNDLSAPATGMPGPDLTRALRGAPAGAPVILLDHQPRRAPLAARSGVALQLSGHTHGGMVVGLEALIARANNGFVSGLYQVGPLQLYVNNGTALWPGFAIRLGKPAELTRITLRRAAT